MVTRFFVFIFRLLGTVKKSALTAKAHKKAHKCKMNVQKPLIRLKKKGCISMANIRENEKDGKIVSYRFTVCLERDVNNKQVRR